MLLRLQGLLVSSCLRKVKMTTYRLLLIVTLAAGCDVVLHYTEAAAQCKQNVWVSCEEIMDGNTMPCEGMDDCEMDEGTMLYFCPQDPVPEGEYAITGDVLAYINSTSGFSTVTPGTNVICSQYRVCDSCHPPNFLGIAACKWENGASRSAAVFADSILTGSCP